MNRLSHRAYLLVSCCTFVLYWIFADLELDPSRMPAMGIGRGPRREINEGCGVDLGSPFERPGELDVVVNYINSTSRTPRQSTECAACSRGPGVCSQDSCDCPNCVDHRYPTAYEILWLLRGVEKYMGMSDHGGYIRKVFIVYNSLDGNGPPTFVDWEVDPSFQLPADCTDNAYVAADGSKTLFAIPHCVIFPSSSRGWPGNNRDASQMAVHRIPGLAESFLYMEDDIAPVGPFEPNDFYDRQSGLILEHLTTWLKNLNTIFDDGTTSGWDAARQHSIDVLSKRYGKRFRLVEGLHCPHLYRRCFLEEIETIFAEGWNYTMSDDSSDASKRFNLLTMAGNYMIDRGSAKNNGLFGLFPAELSIHTHDSRYGPMSIKEYEEHLCEALHVTKPRFFQAQGPGWSDEYNSENRPRNDVKLRLLGYLLQVLPQPSRWENQEPVALLESPFVADLSPSQCARILEAKSYRRLGELFFIFLVAACAMKFLKDNWHRISKAKMWMSQHRDDSKAF